MEKDFNKWLFEVCRIAASHSINKEKDEQYYFVRINLTEANFIIIRLLYKYVTR